MKFQEGINAPSKNGHNEMVKFYRKVKHLIFCVTYAKIN